MANLEVIIGLEVHAQVSTKTKMFCACDNDAWGKPANTTVCPVCMGHPGSLPVPNADAVSKALKASLALGCTVAPNCHFDRKHYFYPDLPSGYQISQYDFPLSQHGSIPYEVTDASGNVSGEGVCRIHRLHMENDAGKLTHRGKTTLCDYNRAGTPLMEIVTEPDLRSAEQAVAFVQALRRLLVAVNASSCDMFKGEMRFDASISLREKGTEKLNPRSEIKNLNSFKALEKALQYEEKRLRQEWEKSGPLSRDITVGWVDDEEKTRLLREKETADDYRYFPEPDIPPLSFTPAQIEEVRKSLPMLPAQLRAQYITMGLTSAQVLQLVDEPVLRSLFDAANQILGDAKKASGIVLTQLIGFLKAENKGLDEAPTLQIFQELLTAIAKGTLSGNAGKQVLEQMVATGKTAPAIIKELGLEQVSDDSAIEKFVEQAIAENADAVASFKAGKQAALGALVGAVMKLSKGQADPAKVSTLLIKRLR